MKVSSTRNETIILIFVAEATVFLELLPINYPIKTNELFQNEGIEIQQNWLEILITIIESGEWSEFVKVCQAIRESSNKLLVVNKERTANASTENIMIQMMITWMIGVK